MKNIILIDLCSYALESVIAMNNVYIAALVTDTKEQAIEAIEKYPDRIGNIYYRVIDTHPDFIKMHKNDYSLSYNEIEKYRNIQLKVEHFIQREVLDYSEIQYRYFSGLQYWLNIFKNYKIDAVISMHSEHGGIWDSIPLGIAIKNNIPAFVEDVTLGNYDNAAYCFRCLNNEDTLNLAKITDKYKKIKLEDYIYNKKVLSFNSRAKFNFNVKWIVDWWKDTLIRMYLKYFKYEARQLFKSKKERFNKRNEELQLWFNMPLKDRFLNTKYIRDLAKTYKLISKKNINSSEKYIYYALHFDPEAGIMNRSVLSNQLYIIKMISDSLPEGWKLYVKEHPHQYRLKGGILYMLKNIFYYRTERFYKNILEMENVKLISLDVPSKILMENAQASATICGTIAMETINYNKPLLLFGEDLMIIGKLKDVFGIKSKQDVQNAIEKIKNGFKPNYNELPTLLSDYLFEARTQEFEHQKEKKEFLIDIFSHMINNGIESTNNYKEFATK